MNEIEGQVEIGNKREMFFRRFFLWKQPELYVRILYHTFFYTFYFLTRGFEERDNRYEEKSICQ